MHTEFTEEPRWMAGTTAHEACLLDVAFASNPFCLTPTKPKPLRLAIFNHETCALNRGVVRRRNCGQRPPIPVL